MYRVGSSLVTQSKVALDLMWFLQNGFMPPAGVGDELDEVQWCFSQVKGAIDDDVADGKSV